TTGRGGGGGSFVHGMAKSHSITPGGSTPQPQDGVASFQCIIANAPPEAVCLSNPVTVSLDDSGTAALSPAQLDGGSHDPDGDELSFSLSQASFDCSHAGDNLVTLSVEDNEGGINTCTATVIVRDDTAPVISCPESTAIACNEPSGPSITGMAFATDNCDTAPVIDFSDAIPDGGCAQECIIERTFTATDAWGNTAACSQLIEKTASGLFEDALDTDLNGDGLSDPIVLGYSRHTLTITAEGAECLLNWLPGAGGTPAPLPRAQRIVDGSDCHSGIPLSPDGRINNPLLAEVLLLTVKVRLDPQLGNTLLSNLDCAFHPVLAQFMGNNPTANSLLRLANLSLGNIMGPVPMSPLTDAVHCINEHYQLCRQEPEEAPMATPLPSFRGEPATGRPAEELIIYPNPAADVVHFRLSNFSGKPAVLRIYSPQGQLVEERRLPEIPEGPLELQMGNYRNGLYIAALYIDGYGMLRGAFVVER
ncbi:MAG: T9SS type A sorting domain-containing protein, partial [Phaeodactylibacter sp.]|nr:T9SS type A sorting domain-containing protein [Phaeodactylibacter sp.]